MRQKTSDLKNLSTHYGLLTPLREKFIAGPEDFRIVQDCLVPVIRSGIALFCISSFSQNQLGEDVSKYGTPFRPF